MTTPASTPSAAERQRQLKQHYREAGPAMGVFAVRNRASGRVRVRASLNVAGAMQRMRFELGLGQHRDAALMAEWRRDGAAQFEFELLDTLKKRDDPAHDYRAELDALLALWREELGDA